MYILNVNLKYKKGANMKRKDLLDYSMQPEWNEPCNDVVQYNRSAEVSVIQSSSNSNANIKKKEYVLTLDELKKKYPLGLTCFIDNEECCVLGYEQPQASVCMASYPRLVYEVVEKVSEVEQNLEDDEIIQ